MANKYRYSKVYIIGSGQLAYDCAEIVKQYLSDVKVFELKVTEGTVLDKLCDKSGIFYRSVTSKELTETLRAEDEDALIVSAASIYLVPQTVIEKPNFIIINWHNALLPAHKGRNAEVWAIYCGEQVTGVTWHMITKDIDAGEIICQKEIPVTDKTTAMSLYREQVSAGKTLFAEFCENLLEGQCNTEKQKENVESQMHFSKDIPNEGMLDLNWNITQLSRFLRAMDYGSLLLMGKMRVVYDDTEYEFYRYSIKQSEECVQERVIAFDEGKLTIKEKDIIIILKGLQEKE